MGKQQSIKMHITFAIQNNWVVGIKDSEEESHALDLRPIEVKRINMI